ncbi:hypothetical protein ACFL0E_00795 [Nanoarchaeota archaeon]
MVVHILLFLDFVIYFILPKSIHSSIIFLKIFFRLNRMAKKTDVQKLRELNKKNLIDEPKQESITFHLIKKGDVDKDRLKGLIKDCIDYTIDSITGISEEGLMGTYRTEWLDYCLIWNCLRDSSHGDYMGRDVKEMLIFHNSNLTYELNRIDRELYVSSFKEAVSELEDKIRGYWDKK